MAETDQEEVAPAVLPKKMHELREVSFNFKIICHSGLCDTTIILFHYSYLYHSIVFRPLKIWKGEKRNIQFMRC